MIKLFVFFIWIFLKQEKALKIYKLTENSREYLTFSKSFKLKQKEAKKYKTP